MPDTYFYFVCAYVVAGLLYVGYVTSLWWRSRK